MSDSIIGLAIFLSIIYSLTLNLSKGLQKFGIEGFSKQLLKQWRQRPELKRKFIFWSLGSIGTMIAVVFQFLAQMYAPNSSFVAAFGGVGLLSLIIFSFYVLKEKINRPEIIGAILVVISTLIFGIMADDSQATSVDYVKFWLLILIPLAILFLAAIWSHKNSFKGHALIWGTISGFFGGLGIALTQTAAIGGEREILGSLLTLDLWLAVGTGQASFWTTQYGFRRGHATIVVTLFNVFLLIVPLAVDLIVLGESIPSIQIAMLIFIAIGVFFLTAFRKNNIKETNVVE